MLSEVLVAVMLLSDPVPQPAGSRPRAEGTGEPVLVERIVAVVEDRPVLLSEVRLLQAVKGLAEEPAREAVIDELLMHREALRLPEVPDAAVEAAAMEALRARVTGAPETALRRLARRQIAILAYVEHRFRPLVRVEGVEVQAALDVAWPEPADRPTDAEAQVRAHLEADRLGRLVEGWVRELREAATIRRLD